MAHDPKRIADRLGEFVAAACRVPKPLPFEPLQGDPAGLNATQAHVQLAGLGPQRWVPAALMRPYRGPPMTLGDAAAAHLR